MAARAALVPLALVLLLSACVSSAVGPPGPAAHAYSGPLHLARAGGAHPDAGAAGRVVDCAAWGDGGSVTSAVYADGATTERPEQALDEQGIFDGPRDGLRIAASTTDRVLYVREVAGVVKEAVIVHDGPATEGAGGPGWYVESWAVCDASEFPRQYTDSIGLQIWTDAAGAPVPTSKIQAWRGPEHCDWQSMTFLTLGEATYVRNPQSDLAEYFDRPYLAHADLPADAVDTGYRRDGRSLWLSADKQLAYVGTRTDLEAWPHTTKPLLCG
jgi:hypothetical protein